MKSGLKIVLITLPLAAIGAGILAFVVINKAPPVRIAQVERASAVRVITAQTQTVTPTVIGFGLVAPTRSFEAIAQVGGTVDYVNPALRDGQILPAGAVLLRLSPADFNLAEAQANANIRAAEARLAELAVAEANQRAALAIEHEALAVKASDLARAETLFSSGTIAQTARDNAQAAHLAQRQKVQGIEGTLALFPTQRAVQTEQIAVYQTNLATAKLNLSRSELTLPFTARVAAHSVEVGQYLKAGQTAAVLDGIQQAEIEVQLALNDLRNLMQQGAGEAAVLPMDPTRMGDALRALGLGARVRLQLGGEAVSWPGWIDRISDGIDTRTGTVGVVVVVDDAYGQVIGGDRPPLAKGMFVEVLLSASPITGVVVPRNALHGGQVYLADADNRLQIVPAQPRLLQGEIALFTDGIVAGSQVVVSTPSPLVAGLLLDPQPDGALMQQLLAKDAAK